MFITGGSRGLGLLMARKFAREGCRTAICARDVKALESAAKDIEQIASGVLASRSVALRRDETARKGLSSLDHFRVCGEV